MDVSAVEATVRAAAKALFRVMWAHLCRTAHPPQAPLSLATHISFDAHKPRDTSNTLYLQVRWLDGACHFRSMLSTTESFANDEGNMKTAGTFVNSHYSR